jgi:hypothetical protein
LIYILKSNGKFILANNNTVKEFMQSHTNKKTLKNGGGKNYRKSKKKKIKKR